MSVRVRKNSGNIISNGPILLVWVTDGKFELEGLIRKLFTVKPRASTLKQPVMCYEWYNDEYIHSLNYSRIFQKQIYSDIHLRLFSSYEYIGTFIRNVRFQQKQWFEAIQQKNILLKKIKAIWHFSDWCLNKYSCPHLLYHLHYPFIFICQNIWSTFFIWIYLYIHSWIYYMDKYIRTFFHENVDNWIYLDIHLWLIGSNKYVWIFIHQRKITFATHWFKTKLSNMLNFFLNSY